MTHEQSMEPAVLEGVAALRHRLSHHPTRVGDSRAVQDWIDALTDDEVFLIVARAEGRTLTHCAVTLGLTMDEVEDLWAKLKGAWAVLD